MDKCKATIGKAIVAAAQSNHKFLTILLDRCNAEVDVVFSMDGKKTTPLMWLITRGEHEASKRLLSHSGWDSVAPDVQEGKTPRMVAFRYLRGDYPDYMEIDKVIGMMSLLKLMESPLKGTEVDIGLEISEKYNSNDWLYNQLLIEGRSLSEHLRRISGKMMAAIDGHNWQLVDDISSNLKERAQIGKEEYQLESVMRRNELDTVDCYMEDGMKASARAIFIAAQRDSLDALNVLSKCNPDLNQVLIQVIPDEGLPWGLQFKSTPLLWTLYTGMHRAARRLLAMGASTDAVALDVHDGKDACTIALEYLDGNSDWMIIGDIYDMVDLIFGTLIKKNQPVTSRQLELINQLVVKYSTENISHWFFDNVLYKEYSISETVEDVKAKMNELLASQLESKT